MKVEGGGGSGETRDDDGEEGRMCWGEAMSLVSLGVEVLEVGPGGERSCNVLLLSLRDAVLLELTDDLAKLDLVLGLGPRSGREPLLRDDPSMFDLETEELLRV